jgi:hypothetical protein
MAQAWLNWKCSNDGKGGERVKKWISIAAIVAIGPVLVSCASQPLAEHGPDMPGFLFGLLHGAISPFALVASAFTDVRIYAFPNAGGWYDLGFVLRCAVIFGGGGSNF